MSYSDFLGRELKEGDTIVIATRVGNSAEMKLRTVVGFTEHHYYNKSFVRVCNPETGRTAEVNLKNVLKVML